MMSPSAMTWSTRTRSSLEIMLDIIQQREEQGMQEVPPALPARPVSKARLPPVRRSLRMSFQKGGLGQDSKEGEAGRMEKDDLKSRFESGENESEGGRREDSPSNQLSVGSEDVVASGSISMSMEECECGDSVGFVLKKIGILEDSRERALQGTLGIQKCFRGHQARCCYHELRRGIFALQSFVRGELARKDYKFLIKRLTAVIIIQRQIRTQIVWRKLQRRQRAVLFLQSAIRGWLTQRHLRYKENLSRKGITEATRKPDRNNPEPKDNVCVPSSILVDLQRQVLGAEAALRKKEEENAALRQQLQQFEKKWSRYESKMKSMEITWQDQLTSLQTTIAAGRKNLAAENPTGLPGRMAVSPEYNACNAMSAGTQALDGMVFSDPAHDTRSQRMSSELKTLGLLHEQQKMAFDDDVSFLLELKMGQSTSSMNPDIELQKLKLRFDAWKKHYKARLREAKVALHKLGHSETEKNRKQWWEKWKHLHKSGNTCTRI